MLTEDYLIRRINQAIALFLHAIGLRKDGQMAAALTDIDIALELLLGMRSVLLKEMDDDSLLQLLTVHGQVDYERLELVAGLYKEEAAIYDLEGRSAESFKDHLRALNFTLDVALYAMPALHVEHMVDIEDLRKWFQDHRLPLDTQAALMDYYQRLLEFDDARLAEANLQRDEILAVLKQLVANLGGSG